MDIHNINNRDRSYSRDSVQYASESSSSTISGQNRGRADTGDSSLSSDTNTSNLSMGPRRRSHRPRGCRGGRKNRKKKNKVPAEIVGHTSSASASSVANSKESHLSTTGLRHPSYPSNPNDRNAPNPSSSEHFPPIQPTPYPTHGGYRPTNSHPQVPLSSTAQQQHDPSPLSNNRTALNTTSAYPNNNTNYMLDSRRPAAYDYNNLPRATSTNMERRTASLSLGEILPPPPPVPDQTEKIVLGPNPYALTKQPDMSNTMMDGANFASTFGESLSSVAFDENYGHPMSTSHAIQKPMRYPVEMPQVGDSLFAISPRSFLTGGQGNNPFAN